jgi:aspartate/methionine/tyrosine aminotransferase
LRRVKAVVDFNQYGGILNGAIAALASPQSHVDATVEIFRQRRDTFVEGLAKIGWPVPEPKATMYVWAMLPESWSSRSIDFCTQLVAATGIAVAPGAGFGAAGEGYVRFALVHPPELLMEATERMASFLKSDGKT